MSRATNRTPIIGIALAIALFALLASVVGALGGPAPAKAGSGASSTALLKPNVTFATNSFFVSNGRTGDGFAKCPEGTRVFSGAFSTTGQHVRLISVGPARKDNGFLVYAYVPPANLSAGITRETARVTLWAWCAPAGQPIVLGKP